MRHYRIAAIPGDGIGTEVIAAGVEVLDALAQARRRLRARRSTISTGARSTTRSTARDAGGRPRRRSSDHDAILFGAVGAPDVPDHVTLWGLRLAICQPFDQYANVRPTRILPGITSPLRDVTGPELDWVIVRENSEGEYAGVGGRVHRGLPEEVATDVVDVHPRRRRRASCASPSRSRARARASCSPSSPSRTRSATAW